MYSRRRPPPPPRGSSALLLIYISVGAFIESVSRENWEPRPCVTLSYMLDRLREGRREGYEEKSLDTHTLANLFWVLTAG